MFERGAYLYPLVCGHELAGTVDAVGEAVQGFLAGDRVAVFPLIWCGQCGPCERGLYAQCLNYNYLGSRCHGGFAEYVVAPARNLLRVPPEVSIEQAALIEPAAVALHALHRAAGCSIGEIVAVFGAGPIGLTVAQWARAMGAADVALFDVVPERLELGRKLGFDHVFDSQQGNPSEIIARLTGGLGTHVCVDAAGVSAATLEALKATRRGGRVVLLGNATGEVRIPKNLISSVMRREIHILGSWNSDFSVFSEEDDWHKTLAAIATRLIEVTPLISHRVPLKDGREALAMMRNRTELYMKVLIFPSQGA
jgi:L-iditol 2-dehydrogenase